MADLNQQAQSQVFNRPVSSREIEYLKNRWRFLQIVSHDYRTPLKEIEYIVADSGWIIHNYGDAMSSSPGIWLNNTTAGKQPFVVSKGYHHKLNFTHCTMQSSTARSQEDDDGRDDNSSLSVEHMVQLMARGTIYQQSIDTAIFMVTLAKKLGWKGVDIVDGHPSMRFAAWQAGSEYGMPISGFEPSKQDLEQSSRIRRSFEADQAAVKPKIK